MRNVLKKIPKTAKKSIQYSFSIIAGLNTIVGIWGYTIKDINNINPQWQLLWWECGLILLCAFIVLAIIFYCAFHLDRHRAYETTINGKTVVIKTGDIFEEEGWKVIPFNDRYDTQVDDVIIARNTLNGKMIEEHVKDLSDLKNTIESAANDASALKPKLSAGRRVYPLGRLIPYKDFLMLSLSHFDNQNRAFISTGEYEQMLIHLWSEMRRVYAAKPIAIPLIGGGITTIEGEPQKNYTEILKCILCTLRRSHFQPEQGIRIILTKELMKKIDINVIAEDF